MANVQHRQVKDKVTDCKAWWKGPAPQEDSVPTSAPDGGDRGSGGMVVRTLQKQNNRV